MQDSKITVALLLSDFQEVKEISSVFKKLGVIPHFYEDLKTFWIGTLERLPALCIVDVKKMSEGDLVLRDHPAVMTEEMPLLFYYTEKTEPLLVSTQHFYHLGVLKKSANYEGSLMAILKRLNKTMALEKHYQMIKLVNQAQRDQIEKLEIELREIEAVDRFQSMVKSVCLEFEKMRLEVDFFKAAEKVFQGIDEIAEFSFLELSFNGQKLISPIAHAEKYRNIPSIWLGQACTKGIESFAQNMGTQVAVDVMGGDIVSLSIKGNEMKPDKLIFIKSKNETFFNNFDWNMLEAYLNGFYASFKNKLDSERPIDKKFVSSFEAMNYLDQYLFGRTATDESQSRIISKIDSRLVSVDFTSLVETILKKSSNRFFWTKFYQDFVGKLEIQSRIDFRVFDHGVGHLGFIVNAHDLDLFFDEAKDFTDRFPYWKYFEDSEGVLSVIIKPKVMMIPMSAFAFLSKIKEADQHLKESMIEERKKEAKKAWSFIEPRSNLDM